MLAAIAAKGVNELAYHRDYAASWVVRLGDGTDLSHAKAQAALDALWPLAGELFRPDPDAPSRLRLPGLDPGSTAGFRPRGFRRGPGHGPGHGGPDRPEAAPLAPVGGRAGRDGVHTEAMGYILAELQSVARAHPDATW